MKYTKFHCPNCSTNFFVRYGVEQNVADIDFTPCCGHDGKVIKEDVIQMDGLIVSKGDVVED